jgi:5,5'-dehydrodivanillate O-demethylase oxygenase subunit
MLSEEENQQLTRVGPGTPMGDLLRRYWHPVAASGEFDDRPTRPMRLLGEDLVIYRCEDGAYAVIDRFCAHRLTDLAMGMVEGCSLRCPRHGWLYSDTGHCVDQPFEEELVEVKLNAYRAQEKAGMVWLYLGPEPAPLIPDWEPFQWQDGVVQVVLTVLQCNWLQCQENTMDGIDMELFEAAFREAARSGTPPPLPDIEFDFDEFEHGFVVRNAAEAPAQATPVTKTSVWPNGLFAGDSRSCRLEWRVPMDDTNTLEIAWFIDRAAPGAELPEQRLHYWYAPTRDEETGEALKTHLLNQKFAVWLNQSPIVDRTKEYLSEGDKGVVMLRNKLFSQMALIVDGGEPKGIIRDPRQNQRLRLPITEAVTLPPSPDQEAADEPPAFPYIAGQPDEAAEAYRKVVLSWRQAPDEPEGA